MDPMEIMWNISVIGIQAVFAILCVLAVIVFVRRFRVNRAIKAKQRESASADRSIL